MPRKEVFGAPGLLGLLLLKLLSTIQDQGKLSSSKLDIVINVWQCSFARAVLEKEAVAAKTGLSHALSYKSRRGFV